MTSPDLTVGADVVDEIVRLAAMEVPGVVRVERSRPTRWRALLGRSGRPPDRRRRVDVRLWIVARPGHPLVPLTRQVRTAVAAAVERLVGLEAGDVDVVVDGVGG